MLDALRQLDRVLRGEATRLPDLRQGTIHVRVYAMLAVVIVLGLIYGACMGSFAAFRITGQSFEQLLASTTSGKGVSLVSEGSQGDEVQVSSVEAWKMKSAF
jgi:hypothetical protein